MPKKFIKNDQPRKEEKFKRKKGQNEWNQKANGSPYSYQRKIKKREKAHNNQKWCRYVCYAMLCHYTCWASNSWMIVKKKEEKKGPKIMSTVFHLTHFLFEHGLVYAPFLDKLIGFFFMTAETRSVVCLFSTYINNHLICYIESLWYFHALVKWSVWR